MATITEWLASLGLSEYVQRFAANDVDVSVLRHLTNQDLKEISVSLEHRRKILASIAELAGAAPTRSQPAGPPAGADRAGVRRASRDSLRAEIAVKQHPCQSRALAERPWPALATAKPTDAHFAPDNAMLVRTTYCRGPLA